MNEVFFNQLGIPAFNYNLGVGSGTRGYQIRSMIPKIYKIINENEYPIVLVQGDTNSVLSGAIATKKTKTKLGHVEAGLRSYDDEMPEELNRIITDHCSDLLFAPTIHSETILLDEGFSRNSVFLTGNTIFDIVNSYSKIIEKNNIMQKYDITPNEYFLVTLHRKENVDNNQRFNKLIEILNKLSDKYDVPIIFPIHPRSKKVIKKYKINTGKIILTDPLDYFSFLNLEKNAKIILTDSGGVQEESCILKVPCVTLRNNTERPETVEVGSNIVAGLEPQMIVSSVDTMLNSKRNWTNPFGNGTAGIQIMDILSDYIENNS